VEDNFLARLLIGSRRRLSGVFEFIHICHLVLQLQNEPCKSFPMVAAYILTFYLCSNLISSLATK